MPKLKIALFQYDLGVGGVQRSLVSLLNNIDYGQYDVDLYIADSNSFFKTSIPESVTIIKIGKLPSIAKLLPFRVVQRIYSPRFSQNKKYDIAIDFNSYQHITAIGALTVPAKKRALWVHGDNAKRIEVDKTYRIAHWLQKAKVGLFDELVVVSGGLVEPTQRLTGFPEKRITVINNYVDTHEIIKSSKEPAKFFVDAKKLNIVSVSRLTHEKGIDLMLQTIRSAITERPDLQLYIIGDGPERKKIESLVRQLDLQEHVVLLGAKPNPYPYMALMDGFISTSRHEGQGINILEAKTLGLQIFIPKHLEKFSYDVKGSSDLVQSIAKAKKLKRRTQNRLYTYNKQVLDAFDQLVRTVDYDV